ncbi:hypothetical protein IOCL1545_000185700 [Leishmania shawi]|uniref:Uncharacterized protein n=1 Tax=Leishmania shawi TaxID=5680 RepID=A0ABR3ECR2_9TRYP
MFTTQDPQDMVVLKTVAFRNATQRVRPHISDSAARTVSQATPRQYTHEEMGDIRSAGNGRDTLMVAPTARSVPCFTFKLPIRRDAGPHTGPGDGGGASALHSQMARTALEEALKQHEDALRSWADDPAQHLSPGMAAEMGARLEPTALRSFPVQPRQGLERAYTGAVRMHFQPSADDPPPRVAALAHPYCRVLAQGSMAGIGAPPKVSPRRTAAEATTSGAVMEAHYDAKRREAPGAPLEESGEDRCVAFASLRSFTPQPQHNRRKSTPFAHSAALTSGTAGLPLHGMPLLPYQLPLRLRPSVPTPAVQHASAVTSFPLLPADTTRRAFLDEQAKRYAQWRNRQSAVLHQLAPDMWGRALPHYAALDQQPRVMDSGLRNHASHVRHLQCDSGVVFV